MTLLLVLLAQDPEVERRSFQVAEGFEVNLYASEPAMAKPIEMNFDSRGRLWVATSAVYPQIVPGAAHNDAIYVLEDADGDGRAERSTLFADGLQMPSGVEPGDGGAYVANLTELIHLKDVNGDGKADQRRTVLSGFGVEDTHHVIHSLRWGPDGALYFDQSIYIHSHVETPHGPRRHGGSGIWRLRPASLELEVFTRGLVNPRGNSFDAWGQFFGTDGAGSGGVTWLIPGATLEHYAGANRFLKSLNAGKPKYCQHEIVGGSHLPEEWRGNLITNDFRANRVVRYKMRDQGSGFAADPAGDVLVSTDGAFRPVDVRQGPDGAIYIADFYNPIIQHGEVDFRDARRDHTRGRIWRISAKGRAPAPRPKLTGKAAELVTELGSPEPWTRTFARRALAERPKAEVLAALQAWKPEDDRGRLEALWVHETIGVENPALLAEVLECPTPEARAAACRILGHWATRVPNSPTLLAARVADPHPRVRLEAVRALSRIRDWSSLETALRVLDQPMDEFLDYALWLTAHDLQPVWMPAFESGRMTFGGNTRHRDFALTAVKSPVAMDVLLARVTSAGWMSDETRDDALGKIALYAQPGDLAKVFERDFDPQSQAKVLVMLERASRERKIQPSGDLTRVKRFFGHGDARVRSQASRLVGVWKVEALRPELEKAVAGGGDERVKRASAEALAALGGAADFFAKTGGRAAVIGLAMMDSPLAGPAAAKLMDGDPTDLIAAFLGRKGGAEALAAALDPKKLPADTARLGLRYLYSAGRSEPALAKVLSEALGLSRRSENVTPAAIQKVVDDARTRGDAARGEAIFRRPDLSCLKCHGIGGSGGQVGPDLVSVGASAPVDYLVDSVLRPSDKQKEGFVSVRVTTKDDEVHVGILARKTAGELVLRDALLDLEVAIPAAQVAEEKVAMSVMPAGLADLLTDAEFADLVRFLSELGKPGPYSVGAARLVRRWRLLDPAADPAKAAGLDGAPLYSRVSGELPLEDLGGPAALVKFEIHVNAGGKFLLKFNSPEGLKAWIDGKPVEVKAASEVTLDRGRRTVVLRVETGARGGKAVLCELADAPGAGSPHANLVGGK